MGVSGVRREVTDHSGTRRKEVTKMKKEHIDLITGLLVGTVIGGMFQAQLAPVLPIVLGILVVVYGLKFLSLH